MPAACGDSGVSARPRRTWTVSGIHAESATLEARRNTVCNNEAGGVLLIGRCCGSIKYNKLYDNRRKNVSLSRVPWWLRGGIKVLSNMH